MTHPLAGRDRWFLDLDGTLADSSAAHRSAYLEALAHGPGELLRAFDYDEHRGRPTDEVLVALGVADPVLRGDLVRRKQAAYRSAVAGGVVTEHVGALALLAWLDGHGCAAYLVTGASRGSAGPVLEGLGFAPFLAGVVTAEDAPRGKPDPAPYLAARRLFCDDPHRVVVVEDAPDGVTAARAAGLVVVQVHAARPEAGVLAYPDLGALLTELAAA